MAKVKQVTTAIKPKSMVGHEHDFVKETNRAPIHCTTCGAHYCNMCGKGLEVEVINHRCHYVREPCKWMV